jgi:hypothetical protein
MPKKSNKRKTPKDINQLAAFIVQKSTKDTENKSSKVKSSRQDLGRG